MGNAFLLVKTGPEGLWFVGNCYRLYALPPLRRLPANVKGARVSAEEEYRPLPTGTRLTSTNWRTERVTVHFRLRDACRCLTPKVQQLANHTSERSERSVDRPSAATHVRRPARRTRP